MSRVGAGLLAVAAVAALTLGYRVYVTPRLDPLPATPADAVVVLGGIPSFGLEGLRLAEQGRARALVLSDPYEGSRDPVAENAVRVICARPQAQPVPTTCFVPDPSTTRGEARAIRSLAEANGWRSVIVVTPAFHTERARMIIRRCYGGTLTMVAPPRDYHPLVWAFQFVYQSAGFAKAAVLQGC